MSKAEASTAVKDRRVERKIVLRVEDMKGSVCGRQRFLSVWGGLGGDGSH